MAAGLWNATEAFTIRHLMNRHISHTFYRHCWKFDDECKRSWLYQSIKRTKQWWNELLARRAYVFPHAHLQELFIWNFIGFVRGVLLKNLQPEPWYPTTPLHLWLHPTIWPASVPSAAYKMRLLGGIQNGSSYQSEPCVCGERLIGITNTTLKKVVGKECISHQTLQTVLTDIKAVLNDRPLSYGTKDPEPLTTSHLFYGRGITSLPYKDSGDTANNPETTWTHSNTCSKTVLVYENIAGKQG